MDSVKNQFLKNVPLSGWWRDIVNHPNFDTVLLHARCEMSERTLSTMANREQSTPILVGGHEMLKVLADLPIVEDIPPDLLTHANPGMIYDTHPKRPH